MPDNPSALVACPIRPSDASAVPRTAFSILPSPPHVRSLPTVGKVLCVKRHMGERGVLVFYSAARQGFIRDENLALVRSLELKDCVLGAFFASASDFERDFAGNQLKAVQKAQDFCRIIGAPPGTAMGHDAEDIHLPAPGNAGSIWLLLEHYLGPLSGAYFHVAPGVFDDEHFSNFQFAKLKSVEYSADLFTFACIPSGIQRLRPPRAGGTSTLVKVPSEARAPEAGEPGNLVFAVARNPPHRRYDAHPEESVASMQVREAVVRQNSNLEQVFLEHLDVKTLSILCARGRLRSLMVQSTLRQPLQNPQIIKLMANLLELAWLHICVQDGLGSAFPTWELLTVLAKRCVE
ncbi:hypothetical protein HOY82DRAFT_595015 [Tuber indicum]|nr:hypothetical protein HOY82DRAFT_595015 [Tuber indicum]